MDPCETSSKKEKNEWQTPQVIGLGNIYDVTEAGPTAALTDMIDGYSPSLGS